MDIKRLFSHFNKVYIVLQDKIIFFEMPILTRLANNDYHLVIYQPYFQLSEETETDKKVIGYMSTGKTDQRSIILSRQRVVELYFDDKRNQIAKDVTPLNFESIQGERERIEKKNFTIPRPVLPMLNYRSSDAIDFKKFYSKNHFFNFLLNDNEFITMTTYPDENDQNYFGEIDYCEIVIENSTKIMCKTETIKTKKFPIKHQVKMFALIQRSFKVSSLNMVFKP